MKIPTLPWSLRSVAIVLALAPPLMAAPLWALNPLDHGSPSSEPVLPPSPQLAVNRLLPEVMQPAKFDLPDQPTAEDITRCGVFSEPLVPMTDSADHEEDAQLAAALQAYQVRQDKEAVSSLVNFCQRRPASRWLVGLEHNLGLIYYHQGYFSKALSSWEQAWELGKGVTGGPARALVNQSFAELVRMNARMGRVARLEQLLAEGEGRLFLGNAAQVLTDTKDALALMKHDPGHSFRCGPLALAEIRASERLFDERDQKIREAESTSKGCSFVQVADLAQAAGMKYQLARRDIGAPVITPAVVHWKVGHYAALIKQDRGKYLSKDLIVGNNTWLSQRVLDEEASGYFLVPQGELPTGWHAVPAAEVADIWGCWATVGNEPGHQSPSDPDCNCCPKNPSGNTGGGAEGPTGVPMPQYNVKAQSVSLTIFDVPVGYNPPVGPSPKFVVTYNHRADGQPATFTFFNAGQNWSTDWLAYVFDDPTNGEADVRLFNRGGGYQTYSGYDAATQKYSLDLTTNTSLMKISDHAYERNFPDGSKEIYAQPNKVTGAGRQVFLTAIIDPQGNSLTLSYDGQFRLVTVKDAVGQITQLTYGLSADPYKITAVTDPFGRTAHFGYTNVSGTYLLTSITDVIGLTSSFQYEGTFINAMTTPYGTTKFSHAENYGIDRTSRSLDAVDPLGGHERTEYAQGMPTVPLSDPKIPAGMKLFNLYLNYSVTYFWDKHAMQVAPGDYTQAKSFDFVRSSDLQQTSGLIETIKNPLESRIWFNYPGQLNSETIKGITLGKPSLVGRILDDSGTTQLYQYSYNSLGNPTQQVDPKGRTTVLTYAQN
jgi:YD repeat-containing protein